MSKSTTVAMTKLELIKLISDFSSSDSHTATINVDGSTINLKKISNLYLGSMYAIFESDKGESVRLEITENQDSAGPALARILDTEYDEFD